MLSEKNCFRLRTRTAQLAGGINAVERRHAYVQHRDIRMMRFRQADGILSVGCLCHDLKFLSLQQRS